MEDDTNKTAEAAPGSPSAKSAPVLAAKKTAKNRSGNGLAWLAILLALGSLGLAGWIYQNNSKDDGVQPELAKLQKQAAANASSLAQLSQSTAQLSQSTATVGAKLQAEVARNLAALGQQTDQRLAALESTLQAQRQQLLEMRSADRSDWSLAEAEYLLRLANQRLLMAGDLRSAQAILNNVDGIIRGLDDPDLYLVRAALAADLAKLRAVPAIDVEGVWLRLQALAEQIDTLVLFKLPAATPLETTAVPGEDWRQRLQQGFAVALERLSNYVVIRRRDSAYQPLMDPQWEGLVRQNLRMLLVQAQSALLSGNAGLYQQSLATSRRWLGEFFAFSETSVAVLDQQLEALQQEQVVRDYPDVSDSLQALKTAVASRHSAGEGN